MVTQQGSNWALIQTSARLSVSMLRIHLLVNPNIVTIIKATQKWEPPSTNTHNKMHEIIVLKVQALIYWNRRGNSRW